MKSPLDEAWDNYRPGKTAKTPVKSALDDEPLTADSEEEAAIAARLEQSRLTPEDILKSASARLLAARPENIAI